MFLNLITVLQQFYHDTAYNNLDLLMHTCDSLRSCLQIAILSTIILTSLEYNLVCISKV